jgi:hypothetical protein
MSYATCYVIYVPVFGYYFVQCDAQIISEEILLAVNKNCSPVDLGEIC